MVSLGDKFVQLSLDIDDKTKTIDLLQNLIDDQTDRHATEATRFEKEKEALLQKLIHEYNENETELFCIAESLSKKKKHLEEQIVELSAEKEVGIIIVGIMQTSRSIELYSIDNCHTPFSLFGVGSR